MNPFQYAYARRNENWYPYKFLYMSMHGKIIHDNQKARTSRIYQLVNQ